MGLAAGAPSAAERLVGAVGPMAWAVDDTGFPKDGDHSVGVQRQYGGTLGKTANGQLGVGQRRLRAGQLPAEPAAVPPGVLGGRPRPAGRLPPARQRAHRPEWQLVLDMVDALGTWDLRPPVLAADAGHGDVAEFRQGLDDRQIG